MKAFRLLLACGALASLSAVEVCAGTRKIAPSPAPKRQAAVEQDAMRQAAILTGGNLRLQQRALRRLGTIPGPVADHLLTQQLDELDAGRLPLGLWLDVLEAAERRIDPTLQTRLAARSQRIAVASDPLKQWRECLEGGDASEGRTLFHERVEAGCVRCHRAQGQGGDIGPDLTGLQQRAERLAILESIIAPNSSIVPGFQNLLLKLQDGREVSGLLTFEAPDFLRLKSITDGRLVTVLTSELQSESALPSPMPENLGSILGKRAVRDLVEYLATQDDVPGSRR